ncbi:disulfide bond formation protein B [Photobacterium phosphoreum]|uniref:disulfide bond formation protein B n=1 Tax=Photobacterium phosphoreum TaxID=659 RepID=UPI003B987A0C
MALFFQHVMGMKPCVLCIYQRLVFVCIFLVALLVSITIKYRAARLIGLLIWLLLSVTGFVIAYHHIQIQLHPSPFGMCDMFIIFPSWLPLDHIAPWAFQVYGECSTVPWVFAGWTLQQWLLIVYAISAPISLFFFVIQLIKRK